MRKNDSRRKRRIRLAKAQKRKCYYCGCRMSLGVSHDGRQAANAATFEHIVPLSKGGTWASENLVIACHACNNARGHGDARDLILKSMGLIT